jgi:hypothetical protein
MSEHQNQNQNQNQLPPMTWLSFVPEGAREVRQFDLNAARILEN